jgi:hypothetical protein
VPKADPGSAFGFTAGEMQNVTDGTVVFLNRQDEDTFYFSKDGTMYETSGYETATAEVGVTTAVSQGGLSPPFLGIAYSPEGAVFFSRDTFAVSSGGGQDDWSTADPVRVACADTVYAYGVRDLSIVAFPLDQSGPDEARTIQTTLPSITPASILSFQWLGDNNYFVGLDVGSGVNFHYASFSGTELVIDPLARSRTVDQVFGPSYSSPDAQVLTVGGTVLAAAGESAAPLRRTFLSVEMTTPPKDGGGSDTLKTVLIVLGILVGAAVVGTLSWAGATGRLKT